ncbi:signal peptide peptidase SppA [Natronomonas sp. EA1]|uniref:signal peptide peptidase SppA n=1 Tax=Natronomonas sp. EA1 TaxID=3421655 RepID=UPI003EC13A0B
MPSRLSAAGRSVVVLVAIAVGAVVGYALFVEFAADLADILGILLVVAVALLAARVGSRVAGRWFPGYTVAEVAVEGPITRDGGGGFPTAPIGESADDIVEQFDKANEDPNVQALLVKLNTPGGEVVPSDDLRRAAERFDGPTVAYTTDICASGGYWIASGCDELWAREGSIVGSIGVRGSRPNVSGLMEKLGIDWEQFTAGAYKEAGSPFSELDEGERDYLQGIIDGYYDEFVETVAEGRGMDPEAVRDTEARVYLGEDALELGLVDGIGTAEDAEARIDERIDGEVVVRQFQTERGLAARLRGGAAHVAYALGAGIASQFDDSEVRL